MTDRKVKETPLSNDQTAIIALQTCQWWNAAIVQGRRFLDAFDNGEEQWPWNKDVDDNAFNVERLLLITTITHALEYLDVLNSELLRRGDSSLDEVYHLTAKVSEGLTDTRNVNEHSIEYIVLPDKKANKFYCTATEKGVSLNTNRIQTVMLGDKKIFLVGDVDIGDVLLAIKEQLPNVKRITESVFYSCINGKETI